MEEILASVGGGRGDETEGGGRREEGFKIVE